MKNFKRHLLFMFLIVGFIYPQYGEVEEVLVFGDSNTRGYGCEKPYPERTDSLMTSFKFINLGVDGAGLYSNNLYINTVEYQYPFNGNEYNIGIIALGTNDVPGFYYNDYLEWHWKNDYRNLVNSLYPVVRTIIVFTIPYWIHGGSELSNEEEEKTTFNQVIEEMNNFLKGYGANNGIPIFDLNAVLGTDSTLFQEDGIHFNDLGQQKIAEALAIFLTEHFSYLLKTEKEELKPVRIKLNAYPNPFNPTTNISYNLLTDSDVRVDIYDLSGKLLNTLVDKKQLAGEYGIKWDGSDYSAGTYIIRIITDDIVKTQKITLLK